MTASTKAYESFELQPINGALGAEVRGLDLRSPLEARCFAELRRAFLDHHVLVFRDQKLTLEQHKSFARQFGPLHRHPRFPGYQGDDEVIEVLKEPDQRVNNGGGWHADLTCLNEPPLGAVLRLTDVPERGGDTLFADLHAAYEALSPTMKDILGELQAVHTSTKIYGRSGRYAASQGQTAAEVNTEQEPMFALHPVVRTHPETGRRSIFVNGAYTLIINKMGYEESNAILQFLYAHCIRGEFTSRLRWQPNTIAMWDNRCTLHYALNDYHGLRRRGLRVAIQGAPPA